MSQNGRTPEELLAVAKAELTLILKRLSACQLAWYKATGTYPDDLGAAIQRTEFLLHGIMAGLVTPVDAKKKASSAEVAATDHPLSRIQ